jgi:hypothetical protein
MKRGVKMLKLNNEQAAAAWEDYKKFHNIQDQKVYSTWVIESSFKYAFALAMDAAEKQEQPTEKKYIKPEQMELIPLPEPLERKIVKGFKRKHKGRITRTFEQRKQQAHQLVNILQSLGETKLMDIIFHMRQSGFDEWNDNNASGFVKDAMNYYPRIKRTGFGLYKYEDQ